MIRYSNIWYWLSLIPTSRWIPYFNLRQHPVRPRWRQVRGSHSTTQSRRSPRPMPSLGNIIFMPLSLVLILTHANGVTLLAQHLPSLLMVNYPQPTHTNFIDSDMKDISTSCCRSSRKVAYPKKRPSPTGISKIHKTPGGLLAPSHKSPYSAKAALLQQRQRDAQIAALRRQGVLLEEEYRDDIRYYLHEMEVRPAQILPTVSC